MYTMPESLQEKLKNMSGFAEYFLDEIIDVCSINSKKEKVMKIEEILDFVESRKKDFQELRMCFNYIKG